MPTLKTLLSSGDVIAPPHATSAPAKSSLSSRRNAARSGPPPGTRFALWAPRQSVAATGRCGTRLNPPDCAGRAWRPSRRTRARWERSRTDGQDGPRRLRLFAHDLVGTRRTPPIAAIGARPSGECRRSRRHPGRCSGRGRCLPKRGGTDVDRRHGGHRISFQAMATRAELFRAKQQREAHPPRPKRPPRPRRDVPVDTAQPGTSATDRRAGLDGTGQRNRSNRAKKKGGAALESSDTGKPSRKSTRKSQGRVKRTSNLARKQIRKVRSAKARALRAKARQR
jgi:hypothetical protein